jgi:RNA polymerase subunit RPABC4/transcription elongation factor Spt4
MNLFCPFCRSDQLRKLSLVFESGLSIIDTRTSGIGFGDGGMGAGVLVGGARTRGHQVTATASKARPPAKKGLAEPLWGMAICAILLISSAWWWIGIILFFCGAVSNVNWNNETWPKLYHEWNLQFMCNRCGGIGIPVTTGSDANAKLDEKAEPVLASPPMELPGAQRAIAASNRVEEGEEKICPHCRSMIPAAATVCRICRRHIPAASA